jgi:CspA family cold shock protein
MGKVDQEWPLNGVASASATSPDELATEITVETVVRWFSAEKGYGFVELMDGRRDAFLHLRTLRLFGRETLPSGAKLRAVVTNGVRGPQVVRIVDVDASMVIERPEGAARRPKADASSAIDLTGRVKWFDGVRGFGFVASDDFGKDVFLHVTTLCAAGASRISEGQAVTMRVVETQRGREAIAITL